jgi:uncharacterized protein YndB with AHSA1/START domain
VIRDGVIRVERRIAAPPDVVFRYLTDGPSWARWQGVSAEVHAVAGGSYVMTMPTGQVVSGRFVELTPNRRVVFTWGWVGDEAVPPGSSTVEIDLEPAGDATVLRLTHSGLPEAALEIHAVGWDHYLPRLGAASEGRPLPPDRGPG